MRKIFNILSLGIVLFAATACDSIGEDERYVEATEINKDHKVLVEEFTGQFCPNCPLGHEALDGIKKMYGENVVIVSIHAGGDTNAYYDTQYGGLGTPDGDVYAAMWGIQGYPSAIVNRTSGILTDRGKWQGMVFKSAIAPPEVKISLEASIVGNTIQIKSNLNSANGNALECKYQIWITEDNFVAFQKNNDDYISDYVHNHVYRASVNGIGGETVNLKQDGTILEHSIESASHWNIEHLNIVAFVYTSDGVLQAEEKEVKSEK